MSRPMSDYQLAAIDDRWRSPRTTKTDLRADVHALRREVERLRTQVQRLITLAGAAEAEAMEPEDSARARGGE